MKIKMKKFISCLNKDKAVIGKEYYFYDNISDFISEVKDGEVETIESHKGILNNISDDKCFIFHKSDNNLGTGKFYNYAFLYPVEEEKKDCKEDNKKEDNQKEDLSRYLTYEELKQLWIENPNMILRHPNGSVYEEYFTIIGFYDHNKTFEGGNGVRYCFSNKETAYSIEAITTIDGRKIILSNFPQFMK